MKTKTLDLSEWLAAGNKISKLPDAENQRKLPKKVKRETLGKIIRAFDNKTGKKYY